MKLKHLFVAILALAAIPLSVSEAANLPPDLKFCRSDSNGDPLSGGLLYTYQAGTTTPQATYTDSTEGTPNANPVVLDAAGCASVWLDPDLSYKFILQNSDAVTQWTTDGVAGLLAPDAVITTSIADDAVTLAKMADDSVGADELRDDASLDINRAVTTNHVRDDAITQDKMAPKTVATSGADPGVGGISISSASTYCTTVTGAWVDATNLSVTLSTSGRPVQIGFFGSSAGDFGAWELITASAVTTISGKLQVVRGTSTTVNNGQIEIGGASAAKSTELPAGIMNTLDYLVAGSPGTYTWKVQLGFLTGSSATLCSEGITMYAYEI
jgi:hypothetical protein